MVVEEGGLQPVVPSKEKSFLKPTAAPRSLRHHRTSLYRSLCSRCRGSVGPRATSVPRPLARDTYRTSRLTQRHTNNPSSRPRSAAQWKAYNLSPLTACSMMREFSVGRNTDRCLHERASVCARQTREKAKDQMYGDRRLIFPPSLISLILWISVRERSLEIRTATTLASRIYESIRITQSH